MNSRRLHQIGLLILILGLLAAGVAYWVAQRQEARLQQQAQAAADNVDFSLSSEDSKRYAYDSELNMGKATMLIAKFAHGIGQWFQGKNLAFTIAALSILGAAGCFSLADRSRAS